MLFQWDLNNKEHHKQYIELSEMQFDKRITHVTSNLATVKGLKFLTMAGPTSSGKTTTANKISEKLFKEHGIPSKTISMDNFYKNARDMIRKEDGNPNFEIIDAIDVSMILKCVDDIFNKNETTLPLFDFKTGCRKNQGEYIKTEKNEVIILEGLHGLNPAITQNLPEHSYKSIYITIGEKIYMPDNIVISKRDIRLMRRLIRDFKHRNADAELTFKLWDTVRESENLYIFPFENNADININALHDYEICVIKHQASNLLKTIKSDSKYYPKASELIKKLDVVPSISEDLVPENSLLREFI